MTLALNSNDIKNNIYIFSSIFGASLHLHNDVLFYLVI